MEVLLIAGLCGVIVGVPIAVVRDRLDKRLRGDDEAATISDLTPLGVIYDTGDRTLEAVLGDKGAPPDPLNAEAFRTLRTNLGFINVDHPPRVIQITSSLPNEGKSFIASRLAVVLAEAGHRVALVDADIRKPDLSHGFRHKDSAGLTTVLSADAPPQDFTVAVTADVHLLPGGFVPPNPSELLSSSAMKNLLEQLRENYDYVIVDSAPVLAVTDSIVLTQLVDAVLFVVRNGSVDREQLAEAVAAMRRAEAPIAGFITNGESRSKPKARYGGDYVYGVNPRYLTDVERDGASAPQ